MDENSPTSAGRLKAESAVGGVEIEDEEGGIEREKERQRESVWKQPYKGKRKREVSAADNVQTADKGGMRWEERKEGEKRKWGKNRERDGGTKRKVVFLMGGGETKWEKEEGWDGKSGNKERQQKGKATLLVLVDS